jgi:hypothetical protein
VTIRISQSEGSGKRWYKNSDSSYYSETAECPLCFRKLVPGGAYKSHVRHCTGEPKKKRESTRYRELFFANNGSGPYPCDFCGKDVDFDAVTVHHRDHDFTNNHPDNLGACHKRCHNAHHFYDMWESYKDRKVGFASPTAGHRKPHSEATKEKLRVASRASHARRRAAAEGK